MLGGTVDVETRHVQAAVEAGRKGAAALRSTSRSLERRQLAAAAQSQRWLERLLAQSKRQAALSEQSLKVGMLLSPCMLCPLTKRLMHWKTVPALLQRLGTIAAILPLKG